MPLDSQTERGPSWGAKGTRISFECQKFPDGSLGVCTFISESEDPVPVLVLSPEAAASLLAYLVGGRLN
jgi:hypothetical protein